MKVFIIRKYTTRERYEVKGRNNLYNLAYTLSLKHRGAIYFKSDARIKDLISDIEGIGYSVEVI